MKTDMSVFQSKSHIPGEGDRASAGFCAESVEDAPAARKADLPNPQAPGAGEDEPWSNWPEPARRPDWD